MQNKKNLSSGFTLIELSIVVVILGLMIGGIMSALTQELRREKKVDLETKLNTIEQALIAYIKMNNRMPCPADGTYVIGHEFFGMEGGTIGSGGCGDGAVYDTDGTRTDNSTPPNANYILNNTAVGVVPVRTLGLPHSFAFDPWGGRFTFAVDKRFTATSAMHIYSANYNTTSITINDTAGNAIITSAIATIVSHGENGHGAFLLSGNRKNSGSTNANEQTNCHCDDTATATPLTDFFVTGKSNATDSTDRLTVYDDITRYYGRWSFPTSTDPQTEIR